MERVRVRSLRVWRRRLLWRASLRLCCASGLRATRLRLCTASLRATRLRLCAGVLCAATGLLRASTLLCGSHGSVLFAAEELFAAGLLCATVLRRSLLATLRR